MLELIFSDPKSLAKDGRNFDCSKCPESIQRIRRCKEDRWDFTINDGPIWPMYVHRGGTLYGFCPAKATWYPDISNLFRLLSISAETGKMLKSGGISSQPAWFIDLLGWFLPRYNQTKFASNVRAVLGDGSNLKGKLGGNNNRRTGRQGSGRQLR